MCHCRLNTCTIAWQYAVKAFNSDLSNEVHVKPVTLHVHDPDIVCLLHTQSAAGDKVLRRVDTGDDIEDPSHYTVLKMLNRKLDMTGN